MSVVYRWRHVLLVNGIGLHPHSLSQGNQRAPALFRVSRFKGPDQARVGLLRKLGVDRQPDAVRGFAGTPRQANGELHTLVAVGTGCHVLAVLLGRKDVLEQCLELVFRPGATRLDVGQHPLQVPDAVRQRAHFPEAALDGFEMIADHLERISETALQSALQLLVHRLADLLQLLRVAVANLL